ncbi:MAG: cupin domain-containing protein [Candidatus Sedimenticola sp. (ex Thyasira tokunagai)]
MFNLLENLPSGLTGEVVESLLESDHLRIERIVSKGEVSPEGSWYDQDEHEWVLLLRGEAKLRFKEGNRTVDMEEGDCINIPAHQKHRVEWTAIDRETIWLALFYR